MEVQRPHKSKTVLRHQCQHRWKVFLPFVELGEANLHHHPANLLQKASGTGDHSVLIPLHVNLE